MPRVALVVTLAVVMSIPVSGTAQPRAEKAAAPSAADIAKWVEQLGGDRFAEREAAGRKLAGLDDVPAALQQAAESGNPEAARRAKAIMAQIQARNRDRLLDKQIAQINVDGFDLFIERMVLKPDYANDDRWAVAIGLAQRFAASAGKLGDIGLGGTTVDWMGRRVVTKLPPTAVRESRVLIDGMNDRYNTIWNCFVLCAGSFSRLTSIQNSVVFVNGDFEGCTSLDQSLLVCVGKVGRMTGVNNSIILATGPFEGSTSARGSLFDVREVGRHTSATGCVYVNLTQVLGANPGENKFIETENGLMRSLRFFDPATLGLSVKLVDGETRAAAVTADRAFARAGLRTDDELLSIGGTKWNTKDEFQRVLRRALLNESAKVRVRRGDRVLELAVPFAESKKP